MIKDLQNGWHKVGGVFVLLPLRRVQAVSILALPVRSVISNNLGQGYAEGLGYTLCGEGEEAGSFKSRQ